MARPTKDEQGRPLGYRSGDHWEWLPKDWYDRGRYRPKRRTVNGKRGTLLPYTTGTFLRPGFPGPKGGRGYQQQWRQTYLVDGLVCRIANVQYEGPSDESPKGKWRREFQPLSGKVTNRYDPEEPAYVLVGGRLAESYASGTDENGCLY